MTKKHVTKWGLGAMILSVMVFTSNAATVPDTNPAKVIKESPIVISTVAQHYENPTLGEYQLCTRSREDCLEKCGYGDETCNSTCPICPILIDQDALVQGINDTLYRLPITSDKVNQTNIIRVINEVRNIVQNSFGNITTNNQNNINVYQNRSRTGGKFGLGYTEKGPCCHVIGPQRCQRSTTGPKCSHRRQRSCGPQCISRVVQAKPVVTCSQTNSDECTQSFEYQAQQLRPGCQYSGTYPFINCNSGTQRSVRRNNCDRCYQLPYSRVMRGQVPTGCRACYRQRNRSPVYHTPAFQPAPVYYGTPVYSSYPSYYPSMQPNFNYGNDLVMMDYEDNGQPEFQSSDNGWRVESRKCLNEDGSVSENCSTDVDNSEDIAVNTIDTYGSDYEDAADDYYDDTMAPQTRHRYRRRAYRN